MKFRFSDYTPDDQMGERLIQCAMALGEKLQAHRRNAYCRLLGLSKNATDQQIVCAIFDLWANGEKLVERTEDPFGGGSLITIRIVKMDCSQ